MKCEKDQQNSLKNYVFKSIHPIKALENAFKTMKTKLKGTEIRQIVAVFGHLTAPSVALSIKRAMNEEISDVIVLQD